jgi:hypothetical protein
MDEKTIEFQSLRKGLIDRTLRRASWPGAAGRGSEADIGKSLSPPLYVAPEPPNATFPYARDMAKDRSGKEFNLDNQIDNREVQEMIDSGNILEADGNLWQIPSPTYKVKGKSASEQLIEERESY